MKIILAVRFELLPPLVRSLFERGKEVLVYRKLSQLEKPLARLVQRRVLLAEGKTSHARGRRFVFCCGGEKKRRVGVG